MLSADFLRREWCKRTWLRPLHPVMDLTEDGLVLGAGTVLAEKRTTPAGMPELALEDAEGRILAFCNPDEPRVPAGNPDGGRWTSDGAAPQAPVLRQPGGRFEPVNHAPVNYTMVHGKRTLSWSNRRMASRSRPVIRR
jgi:hypothetical protein